MRLPHTRPASMSPPHTQPTLTTPPLVICARSAAIYHCALAAGMGLPVWTLGVQGALSVFEKHDIYTYFHKTHPSEVHAHTHSIATADCACSAALACSRDETTHAPPRCHRPLATMCIGLNGATRGSRGCRPSTATSLRASRSLAPSATFSLSLPWRFVLSGRLTAMAVCMRARSKQSFVCPTSECVGQATCLASESWSAGSVTHSTSPRSTHFGAPFGAIASCYSN